MNRVNRQPLVGRQVTVFGGEGPAIGHIADLLEQRAIVTVVAPTVSAAVNDLVDRGLISWSQREPALADLAAIQFGVGSCDVPPTPIAPKSDGHVILVGGGPGDPGLLTVAGREALERADVIVTDRLAPLAALKWARPDAEIIDVAKIPGGRSARQEDINQLLIGHARAGRIVVRFKGGDNFVFGRGGEELIACLAAGLETQVIPGVSSSIAAPAAANIPVTHRGLTQAFTVISGHVPPGHPDSTLDYGALANSGATLVLLMAVKNLPAITTALIEAGMDPETPAAMIADGALPSQRVVRASLAKIAAAGSAGDIKPPAVCVIGAVASIDGLLP